MMWIAHEDAIEMYARFCRAHYGAAAGETVRARAKDLERIGDLEGRRVWNEVAEEIDKQQQAGQQQPAAVH
ncbi:MAG: hypothetical protein P8Y53_07450 [Pseudolabrys sp.]